MAWDGVSMESEKSRDMREYLIIKSASKRLRTLGTARFPAKDGVTSRSANMISESERSIIKRNEIGKGTRRSGLARQYCVKICYKR